MVNLQAAMTRLAGPPKVESNFGVDGIQGKIVLAVTLN